MLKEDGNRCGASKAFIYEQEVKVARLKKYLQRLNPCEILLFIS